MGLTSEPTVCFTGSAAFSRFRMELGHTRKVRAVSLAFQPKRLLIFRIRKRCVGE